MSSKEVDSIERGLRQAGAYLRGEVSSPRETHGMQARRNQSTMQLDVRLTHTEATALVMLLEDEQGRGASEIAETLGCSERDAEKFLSAVTPLVQTVKQAMLNGD
ncbi:MAG: hypothetical protein MSG64_02185 [Pyrinomonadaceae bacterium MAG19_C2-C3]|nr:hypothetical protein [Pyrinomonadaceae bacterium MAG19_C2-C3]